jgi:hypothetical protein
MAALVVAALTVSASAFAQSSLTLASTAVGVNPDGSETIGTLPTGLTSPMLNFSEHSWTSPAYTP